MIVYVDLEHDWLKENRPATWEQSLARRLRVKYRLEQLCGDLCLIVRYLHLSPVLLRGLQARVVVVSGCHTDFEHYSDESLAGLRAVFQEAAWPVLSLSGGFQLMAQAHGSEIGPMGALSAGEPDPYEGAYLPGMKQERGFMPVKIHTRHPLLDGLGQAPVFFQSHYWEVKSLASGFMPLAESQLSPVQAIAHAELPLYGVQFHPEDYDELHPAGCRVLENFLELGESL